METKTSKGKEIKIPGPDHSFSIRLYAPERISGENRRDRAATTCNLLDFNGTDSPFLIL